MTTPPILRVVLTGGPCAGKTLAQQATYEYLRSNGLHIYCVPEASTMLLSGGVAVRNATLERLICFQRSIVRVQLAIEAAFEAFALSVGEPAVLLCDRGLVDGAAYLPAESWAELLRGEGLDATELSERRYFAVVHLVTAAQGAEHFFSTQTNPDRYEDRDGALRVERNLREAWGGHPRLTVIDNHGDFDAKKRRVIAAVCDALGVSRPPD